MLSVTLRRPQRNAQGIADTRSSRAFRSFAIRSSSALSRACISLGARYPLPRCPANAHFQTTVRAAIWRVPFARTPARSSRHHRGRSFRAIDRRCTDNGRPHRRNRDNRAHRDPASVIDADGTANRGRHQARLRSTPAQHSEGTAGVARSLPPVRAGCSIDRRGARDFGPNAEPIPRGVTKRLVSPCQRMFFSRQATVGACRQHCAQAVERVPNESRPNR
jgi:hypothetical protein